MAIFCLVGKTGSGKDTIRKYLEKETDLKPLILSTTRPMRSGEQDGVDYWFKTAEQFERDRQSGRVVALQSPKTVHGEWHYYLRATSIEGYKADNYLTAGSAFYMDMLSDFMMEQGVPVISIYVDVEDSARMERLVQREAKARDYKEMCRRYLSDEKDFSFYEKYPYDYIANNSGKVEVCVSGIVDFMGQHHVGIHTKNKFDLLEKFFWEA